MTDIVNGYFRMFYPAEIKPDNFEFDPILGGMWRYRDPNVSNIFPEMLCADGFHMSVQGHCGAYSRPRDDFAEMYTKVEVGFPSARVEDLMPFIDGDPETTDPLETVYGYVPISVVEKVIADHGGLVGPYEPPKEET